MTPPVGLDGIKAAFGSFRFRSLSGVDIDIDDTWEQDNLVRIRNVCGTGRDIRLHWRVAASFEDALAAALRAAPRYGIRLLGGYCPRQKKLLSSKLLSGKTGPLSTHAWGIAFDVNWDTNGFAKKLVTDLPPEFIAAFTARGWEWGGTWKSSKDAMHFQYCRGY